MYIIFCVDGVEESPKIQIITIATECLQKNVGDDPTP